MDSKPVLEPRNSDAATPDCSLKFLPHLPIRRSQSITTPRQRVGRFLKIGAADMFFRDALGFCIFQFESVKHGGVIVVEANEVAV